MWSEVWSFLRWVLFILVILPSVCGSEGSASPSLAVSSPKFEAAPHNTMQDVSKKNKLSIITEEVLIGGPQKDKLHNNSPLSQAPVPSPPKRLPLNNPGLAPLATHSTEKISFHSPAIAPTLIATPVKHEQSHGIPVAAPSKGIAGPRHPINHPYEKGFSPELVPSPPVVNETSDITNGLLVSPSHSSRALPMMSPISYGGKHADSPLSSHPHSSVSSSVISPVAHEISPSSNAHAPLASHEPSESFPIISPVPHEGNTLSNTTFSPSQSPHEGKNSTRHALVSSHLQPSGLFQPIIPMPHEVKEPTNAPESPLHSFPLPLESSPSISPIPHEVKKPSHNAQSPLPSHVLPSEFPPVESPARQEVSGAPIIPQLPLTSHSNSSGLSHMISPTHSSTSHPVPLEFSPAVSPIPHEVKDPSNIVHAPITSDSKPSRISPIISPATHEDPSNVIHSPLPSHRPPELSPLPPPHFSAKDPSDIRNAPLPSQPEPSRISPMISPTRHEVKERSNITLSPLSSHALPSIISPTPHEVKGPSNAALPPLSLHPVPSPSSPIISPAPHEVKGSSNIALSPLPSHPSPLENSPAASPVPHGVKVPLNATEAPLSSYLHPPPERIIQTPALAPTISRPQHGAPLSPSPPSACYSGPMISPIHSQTHEVPTNNKRRKYAPSPYIRGPSKPPLQSLSHPPGAAPKHNQRNQAPALSPVQAPFPSKNRDVSHASSPSSVIPSRHNKRPIHSPILPPGSSRKPRAPPPQIVWALPPLPPNLACKSLSCQEPVTYPPPGSICLCVLPIKVSLRLSISPYTFFQLVAELAQEVASGIFVKQSQVRIRGANAASEDPEKTVVLVDLVPLGRSFDINTALLIYDRFWHKQVLIKVSYFGDYDVLYVHYPGLPPSPPMAPGDVTPDGETFANGESARRTKPLGVDVRKRNAKHSGGLIAVIVLSSVTVAVISAGVVWILLIKHRNHSDEPLPTSQQPIPPVAKSSGSTPLMLASGPSSTSASFTSNTSKTFSLAEIERATNRFNDSRLIGEGGFGRVYQGILEDGTMVAVKILKRDDHQGGREFLAEVEMLSRLHHRNLVKLIGICIEKNVRCLVYELVPSGSVESHLHRVNKQTSPLDWNARMKIALGAARGLAYLHEDSSPRVIHRDFKSSNILLEHDFTPKVSDFGLAREALDEGSDLISTRVMGTFGYVAPEYAMTGHLLVKSDVYSYGVVLLELLTGRKPVDMSQPPGQETLVNWALPLLTSSDGLERMIDPALGASISLDIVAKVAAIASMCVQPEVSHRPYMGEVVQALKLVCNDSDGDSRSHSHEESSTRDTDIKLSTEERMLSESDIFCTSATFDKDASGSFRRYSCSGPMRTGRSKKLWERVRGFSSGSIIENQAGRRLGSGVESEEHGP